jgi:glucan phosphorylase
MTFVRFLEQDLIEVVIGLAPNIFYIPLYYQRDQDGLPRGWIKRVKRTIRTLGWWVNADRMVMDYTLHCYVPAAGGTSCAIHKKE